MGGGGCRERVDRMDVVKVCLAAKSKQKNVRKKEWKEEICGGATKRNNSIIIDRDG